MAADPRDIKTEAARQSLTQGMEDVYNKLPAGEAFDAKKIITDGGQVSLTLDGKTQDYLETVYTTPGFTTKMQSLMTQFNTKALNFATGFWKHNNTKYTSNSNLR
jgi:hypothetical protein